MRVSSRDWQEGQRRSSVSGSRRGRPPGRAPMVSIGGIGVSVKTTEGFGGNGVGSQQRTCVGVRFERAEKITTGSAGRIGS